MSREWGWICDYRNGDDDGALMSTVEIACIQNMPQRARSTSKILSLVHRVASLILSNLIDMDNLCPLRIVSSAVVRLNWFTPANWLCRDIVLLLRAKPNKIQPTRHLGLHYVLMRKISVCSVGKIWENSIKFSIPMWSKFRSRCCVCVGCLEHTFRRSLFAAEINSVIRAEWVGKNTKFPSWEKSKLDWIDGLTRLGESNVASTTNYLIIESSFWH